MVIFTKRFGRITIINFRGFALTQINYLLVQSGICGVLRVLKLK